MEPPNIYFHFANSSLIATYTQKGEIYVLIVRKWSIDEIEVKKDYSQNIWGTGNKPLKFSWMVYSFYLERYGRGNILFEMYFLLYFD